MATRTAPQRSDKVQGTGIAFRLSLVEKLKGLVLGVIRFFWLPRFELTEQQKIQLSKQLLRSLARRTTYWLLIVYCASVFVYVFGVRNMHVGKININLWVTLLLALAVPHVALLIATIRAPRASSILAIRTMHAIWSAWAVVIAICWFVGNGALINNNNPQLGQFVFSQSTFLWFTMYGHIFTVLLLSPSILSLCSVLIAGYYMPFVFFGSANLPERIIELSRIYHTTFCAMYLIIGWILYVDQRRMHARGILVEAERRRAEAERARANHFVAAISHDLRQPLTTVKLKLASLRSQGLSSTIDSDIDVVQQQVIAMETMINGSLDLSRLEAGTWSIEVREVALPLLVEKVVADLKAEIDAKRANVKLEAQSLPYLIKTDPVALDRILRNLLGNALRYTPEKVGGWPGKIGVECNVDGNHIRISVVDNGIGIPQERLLDIFKE